MRKGATCVEPATHVKGIAGRTRDNDIDVAIEVMEMK
jgi:hypothetical protein